jgi:hypothetical protein
MKIQRILLKESIDIVARMVKSKDNKADVLLRYLRLEQNIKNQVVIKMPDGLENLLEQMCCTRGGNYFLSEFDQD